MYTNVEPLSIQECLESVVLMTENEKLTFLRLCKFGSPQAIVLPDGLHGMRLKIWHKACHTIVIEANCPTQNSFAFKGILGIQEIIDWYNTKGSLE